MYAVRIAGLILIIGLAVQAGGIIPLNRPDSDIYYDYQRELYLRGGNDDFTILFAPVYSNMGLDVRDNFEYLTAPLTKLKSNYSAEKNRLDLDISIFPYVNFNNDDNKAYMALSPGLTYGFSDMLTLTVSYKIDGALLDDSLYQGKKWDNFAGYTDLAVISYRDDRLKLDIGRRRSRWGIAAESNSLFLSSTAMAMDGIFIDYKFNRHLSGHMIAAYLSPLREASPFNETEQTENRYFSAHALRIAPFSWWDIILKESVIYGGIGRRFELAYTFPAIWYHAEQLNENVDDNTFFGFETVVRLHNRFAGYLEVLLDDIQIEKEDEYDNEPSEYGFTIGADLFDWPFHKGWLEGEYTRINNYTYNQIKSRNVYINQNYPIGHPFGPDCETYSLSYSYHVNNELTVSLKGSAINKGEGYLGKARATPWADDPNYTEKFPSGVVERRLEGHIGINYVKNDWLVSKLAANVADIKNNGNYQSDSETDWSISIQIIIHSPKLSWRFSDE